MGHYDAAYEADAERERQRRAEHARNYGPLLLTKVNGLLWDSKVSSARIDQKRNELRDAIIIWMYEEGALVEG